MIEKFLVYPLYVRCSTSYEFIYDRQLHLICRFNSCWKKIGLPKHNPQWGRTVIKTKPVNCTVNHLFTLSDGTGNI